MSSSFPLMAIARQYDVDYSDVLVWAGWARRAALTGVCRPHPGEVDAWMRCGLDDAAFDALNRDIVNHAYARWRPEWKALPPSIGRTIR